MLFLKLKILFLQKFPTKIVSGENYICLELEKVYLISEKGQECVVLESAL